MAYSQLGQDEWVVGLYGKNPGFFVDVGFNDGIVFSNTYLLEKKGWIGIGIDPFPFNYKNRPRTMIYEDLVYDKPNITVDVCVCDVYTGVFDDIRRHKEKTVGKPMVSLVTKTLECVLDVANCPKFIEYLSLDTEGSEHKILSSFDFNKYCFGCITVEHNHEKEKRKNIRNKLEENGYEIYKQVKFDDWYIKSSMKEYFSKNLL
jgi:hypothetical protein